MKKIIASAVGLMLVGGVAATTASAVESQFGGYWRTRAFFNDNFKMVDVRPTIADPNDATQTIDNPNFLSTSDDKNALNNVDTRTRLYYTAKFSDDLKFVNKFEFNTSWGDAQGGDLGADGKGNFRIKQSYVDFTLGKVNTKVGIQYAAISRGFILGDEFSGIIATADLGMVKIPVLYGALSTEDANSLGWDGNGAATVVVQTQDQSFTSGLGFGGGNGDVHLLSIMPSIKINDMVSVTPHATWATVTEQDTDIYYLGVDADMKFDAVSVWATGIYNGGSIDKNTVGTTSDLDISAFLLAAGADANLGMVSVHGQAFYSSGDDDVNDSDIESFVLLGAKNATGASYYWAEIMGDGMFDYQTPSGGLGEKISNIWALNAGVSLKPMDKLGVNFDIWYAQNAEEVSRPTATNALNTEDEMGLELDAKVSYALMDNLNADLVFAYLFAGDVFGNDDIMEGGLQLSLSF